MPGYSLRTLDFYGDSTASPAGTGLGQTLLGSASVVTDGNGNASFTATVAALPAGETFISATATDPNGNISNFSHVICLPPSALGTVYDVYTTADSGPGSLRQVILNADAAATGTAANPDDIVFCIPVSDPGYQSNSSAFTIKPTSALPTLTDTVVIDGYTQPGATPNTLTIGDNAVLKIVLDGSLAGAVDGLVIGGGGNSTVRGLVIDNFATGYGIELGGSGNDLLVGNFIGTDVTGVSVAANIIGADASSPGNLIGGSSPGARNIISGNNSRGVDVLSGNVIQGNYIGTDKSGTCGLPNGSGIFIDRSDNTIGGTAVGAGNVISGNTVEGIHLSGSQNLVVGNLIGTTVTGLAALGNNGNGITVWGNNNTIGGTISGARNVISGNSGGVGIGLIQVASGGASYNLVEGNYLGTDITGTTSLGAQIGGITIAGDYNTIGGSIAAARNLISGNGPVGGIQVKPPPAQSVSGNVVQGNYIGTDAGGTYSVGNGQAGIVLDGGATNNTIGGTLPGEGNLISGGISLFNDAFFGGDPTGNLIQGNLIGADKTGIAPLRSFRGEGIYIRGGDNNTIGGTTSGAGNTIAFNNQDGVLIDSGTGNSILSNSIFSNTPLGIFLNSANNANDNQAAPVLTAVSSSGSGTTITGTLQSVANTTYRIEFFANQTLDPSGYGQGQTFLGFATVTTDASGNANFTAGLSNSVPLAERYISATATVANSNSTFGDSSQFAKDLFVPFNFSGFLPPLNQNMAFALNRAIPIKFQLTDVNGALITSLSAVTSLQIAPVNPDNSLGTPFNPRPTPGTSLRNDGSQYIFNWQTKGLAAGTYEILLTLADGTLHTKVLQLTKNGSSAGLTTVAAGGTGTAPGGLLGGDIDLYVDNTNADLTADELARIQDAVTAANAVTAPYGVAVMEVTDPTLADVTLNMDTTSAVGGYAAGVLGCTTDAGQITIIIGWNFYAASDATQIGYTQYDFETVVEHELGHALGLGHSTDSTSVMYATLNTGAVNRTLTTADLNVPDTGTTGACGLHAAIIPTPAIVMPPIPASTNYASRDAFFALQVGQCPASALMHGGKFNQPGSDATFAARMENGPANRGLVDSSASMPAIEGTPIFAAASLSLDEDVISGTLLFSDPLQNGRGDDAGPSKPAASQPDGEIDFMPNYGVIWLES
jgi:hypothetical protein